MVQHQESYREFGIMIHQFCALLETYLLNIQHVSAGFIITDQMSTNGKILEHKIRINVKVERNIKED